MPTQKLLTRAMVMKRVNELKKFTDDFEVAHGMEDQLREDVLKAIAEGKAADPKAIAQAALETSKVEFTRACA